MATDRRLARRGDGKAAAPRARLIAGAAMRSRMPATSTMDFRSMKLVRYGAKGAEKPGLVDKTGQLRDLSGEVGDFRPRAHDLRADGAAGEARSGEAAGGARRSRASGRRSPRPGHFIAIGLNYADHAAESGMPIPKEPILFSKAPSSRLRSRRRRDHPEGLEEARLGGRARLRHRQARLLCERGRRAAHVPAT